MSTSLEKWDRSRYAEHRKKVLMAAPAVDTKGFQTATHLLVNMKKIQMRRDLQALMEKQNYIHSAKLNAIHQSHGRLDNWNYYPQRSLNVGLRRQNQQRICEENGNILERILKRESEYGKWQSQWEKVEHIRENISRYPRHTGPAGVGPQRVTFMAIQQLPGESWAESSHSSRMRLKNISQKESHKKIKGSPFYTESQSQFGLVQEKKYMDTLSYGSRRSDSGKESACSCPKERALSNAGSEIRVRCRSGDQKSSTLDNSPNNYITVTDKELSPYKEDLEGAACEESSLIDKSPSLHEQDQDRNKSKENCSEAAPSDSYVGRVAYGLDTERQTSLSYSGSDQDALSDTSSNYSADSFQSSTTSSTEVSDTLSHLSLTIKSRSSNKGTTSEKARSLASSVNKTESVHSSQDDTRGSKQDSKRSYYEFPEYTYTSLGTASKMTNKSPDAASLVTNRIHGYSSEGASMRAFSRSSASSV